MIDTIRPAGREWLCLLFFLPTRHGQARVRAWRRLQRLGAVLLNNAAYTLPASAESREDFEWIRQEIVSAGGQATVLVARSPDAAAEDAILAAFRAARRCDFEQLAAGASKLVRLAGRRTGKPPTRQLTQGIRRIRERFAEKAAIDFVDTPERDDVTALLSRLDELTGRNRTMHAARTTTANPVEYQHRVWITRPRPGVDRMSSAWLIRRFIDPRARFVFGTPASAPSAIPFETFEADFGHHGSLCTFETFCERFGLTDPAVLQVGRIVHDLDLKEATYEEPDAQTVGRLVEGLRRAQPDDDALLKAGMELFEALYQSLSSTDAPIRGKPERTQRRKSVARPRSKRS
jgi:hypothetical protein